MAVVRFDPAGADAATVVTAGTVLDQVVVTGSGTVKYKTAAGANRGAQVGVEFLTGAVGADTAYVGLTATAADAAGRNQAYIYWPTFPTGNALVEFLGLRSGTVGAGSNLIRFLIATSDHTTITPGSVICQNAAGGTIGTLGVVNANTWNRYEVAAAPGTSITTGGGDALIYDDNGVLLFSLSHTAADLNTGTAVTVARSRMGKVAGTGANFQMWGTQLAIDTAPTLPDTIPGVAKSGALGVTAVVIPASGTVPFTVTGTATATAGTGTPKSYSWVWGDGGSSGATSSNTATHSFTVAGSFSWTVTVVNT